MVHLTLVFGFVIALLWLIFVTSKREQVSLRSAAQSRTQSLQKLWQPQKKNLGIKVWEVTAVDGAQPALLGEDNALYAATTRVDDSVLGFVSAMNSGIVRYNLKTGAVEWTKTHDKSLLHISTVPNEPSYLLAASESGRIYLLESKSGRMLWATRTNHSFVVNPTYSNGTVLAASHGGYIIAVDAETGKTRWQLKAGSYLGFPVATDGLKQVFVSCDGTIYCLNLTDGSMIWNFKTKGSLDGRSIYSNGVLYSAVSDKGLYAVKTSDGALLWSLKADFVNSTQIQGSRVYFTANIARVTYLICARVSDGTILWKHSFGRRNSASALIVVGTRLYVIWSDLLYAVSTKGKVIWKRTLKGKGSGILITKYGLIVATSYQNSSRAYLEAFR